jgi:uncharacterized YccA/Bax inhibitor family protein
MANPTLEREFGTLPTTDSALASTPVVAAAAPSGDPTMSIGGTATKTLLLLILVVAAGSWGWGLVDPETGSSSLPVWWFFVSFGVVGLAIVTAFKPQLAIITGPLYAITQGVMIGSFSHIYNVAWDGIVLQAIIATVAVFISMLFLFVTGIIKVTAKFRGIVIGSTVAIALLYLASFIMSLFGWSSPAYSSGAIGIGFSILVVGIAALNLMVDFDMVVRGVNARMPKQFEWYAAFGLTVTIIWLYIEILRLLGKSRN